MAKRGLETTPPPRRKRPKDIELTTPPPPPLSPADITSPHSLAMVNGMIASVSPLKPSKYFDGELTDGDAIIRFVGFQKEQRERLHAFCEEKKPIAIKNCQVKWSKFKNQLEIILKSSSEVEPSENEFHVPDLKTVGSALITLNQLNEYDEYDRITVKALVKEVEEPQTVGGGKIKQGALLCDSTGSATITLWEGDVGMLIVGKSYQLNRVIIRRFLGQYHLSMPPSGATAEEIDDLENVIATSTSITKKEDHELMTNVTVAGVQLENLHTCVSCKAELTTSETVTTCTNCNATQIKGTCKQTAKLIISSASSRVTVRAYKEALTAITLKDKVTSEDLLFAKPFNIEYNKYHVVTKVFCN